MANELYRLDRLGDIDGWIDSLNILRAEQSDLSKKIEIYSTNANVDEWKIQLLVTERLINVHLDNLYYSAAPDNNVTPIYNQYSQYAPTVKYESIGGVIYNNLGKPPKFDTTTLYGKFSQLVFDIRDAARFASTEIDAFRNNPANARAACEELVKNFPARVGRMSVALSAE